MHTYTHIHHTILNTAHTNPFTHTHTHYPEHYTYVYTHTQRPLHAHTHTHYTHTLHTQTPTHTHTHTHYMHTGVQGRGPTGHGPSTERELETGLSNRPL